jgi:hypothetical protein
MLSGLKDASFLGTPAKERIVPPQGVGLVVVADLELVVGEERER